MAYARVRSRAVLSLDAPEIGVETHLANGLPAFSIVGLPEAAVRESRDRVRAALQNSGFEFPARRITVNLSPADVPKEGSRYDLPIALGVLAASGQLPIDSLHALCCIGELSLDGAVRSVTAVLPTALAAKKAGEALLCAEANQAEAALVSGLRVYPVKHLLDAVAHLSGQQPIAPVLGVSPPASARLAESEDLSDVKGQAQAKRALLIAASGGHHLLMVGPPGTGKTLLARRLVGLLPSLSEDQALELAAIRSVAGLPFRVDEFRVPAFRSPHHSCSGVALVGGGAQPKPGEISLAHHGVLFLDELTEFDRKAVDVLREPIESGVIHIARAARQAEYPARFQLVGAMNPCPQGFDCDLGAACRCSVEQRRRHQQKLSAPFVDRMDLQVNVLKQAPEVLSAPAEAPQSNAWRERVSAVREHQLRRQGCLNRELSGQALDRYCALSVEDQALLHQAVERLGLSSRSHHRVLRVARTITDVSGAEAIERTALMEALSYRALDRWMR